MPQTGYLIQIDGWDPVAGAAATLRAASHDDEALCHLNGQVWWPSIAALPKLRYDLFDGAFGDGITTPTGEMALSVEPFPLLPRQALGDARIRLWSGNIGDAFGAFMLRFDGLIEAQPQIADGMAQLALRVDDRWLDRPLLATYAGTSGIEGDAAIKGQVKPLLLGAPRFAPGVMVDTVDNILQLSAYGAIEDVEIAFERLGRFAASTGDYPSFAALDAAAIPNGRFATCKAQGFVKHGAPPDGLLSYHVRGDKAGSDGWARLPGELIRRIAILGGGAGRISDASLDALDIARPWNISVAVTEQTTPRELIQRIAASVNAVAGVTWTGKLFVLPIGIGASSATLSADGSTLPPVGKIQQLGTAAPFWRFAQEAEKTWTVHGLGDVAFTAQLIEMGLYSAGETYREGNIVNLADGSRYLYINPTPSAGNAPPNPAFWSELTPGTTLTSRDATPPVNPPIGFLWIRPGDNRAFRFEGAALTIGGEVITIGGEPITCSGWVEVQDSDIEAARALAAQADAKADEAIDALDDLADDGVLTVPEKITVLIPKAAELEASWGVLDGQAAGIGITTARTAAASARTAWLAFLSGLYPAWNDVTGATAVTRSTYRSTLGAYDLALDTLDEAIKAYPTRNVFRGAWNASVTDYVPGDVVTLGAANYVASQNVPVNTTPPNDSYWDVFSQGLNPRGAYAAGTTYRRYDVVTYNGGSYIALVDTTGNAPSGTAQANAWWDVYAAPGAPGEPAVPPSAFNATIDLGNSSSGINLRTAADAAGYTGLSNATITFEVESGITIRGVAGSGIGIDTGSWPTGDYTITLSLVVKNGGLVDGGGGNGGNAGGNGGAGGDAIHCRVPIGITINAGGIVRAGGGGGGGGNNAGTAQLGRSGGGGGGGGAPNGNGGSGGNGTLGEPSGNPGSPGTTSGGGAGGTSPQATAGAAGATFATAGSGASPGGAGGPAGYAVRKNGFTVPVTNNGTMTGVAG